MKNAKEDADERGNFEDPTKGLEDVRDLSSIADDYDWSAEWETLPRSSSELTNYDPLQSYISEIRSLPTLTRQEEHELAVRYHKSGDKVAGYKLVLANLRLVVVIAREYQRNFQNMIDLIQEGNIGLMEAVNQFDPFRGTRFPSYAAYWIRAYMLRYIINNLRLVKIGTTQAQRKLFFNLNKEKEKLESEGFVPEAKLLAKRLNVREAEVIEMQQRLALPDLSVDAPVSGNGESENMDFHSVLPDKSDTAEEIVAREQFSKALREAIAELEKELDEKEKAIIERRLFTDEPVTLQELADDFGLSRERIRQIESQLKLRLKSYLQEKLDIGDMQDVPFASEDG
ncbi:MAG: RNA polymerase factor sigma-32 [Deltaproteobacteria bacterium]|nr:RNA polymerase factor sigma-32 [Deltaproteobacteria bacterium]